MPINRLNRKQLFTSDLLPEWDDISHVRSTELEFWVGKKSSEGDRDLLQETLYELRYVLMKAGVMLMDSEIEIYDTKLFFFEEMIARGGKDTPYGADEPTYYTKEINATKVFLMNDLCIYPLMYNENYLTGTGAGAKQKVKVDMSQGSVNLKSIIYEIRHGNIYSVNDESALHEKIDRLRRDEIAARRSREGIR